MLCQIKLPAKNIRFSIDLSKIDVIEVGKNPDLEDELTLWILFYKAGEMEPAFRIDCSKLKVDEVMDLHTWLTECKAGKSDFPVFDNECLKSK